MIRLSVAALLLLSAPALAQSVQQGGTITPGHVAKWVTNGVIGDAGPASGGSITQLGITNAGLPFCIDDAPIIAGYHQLCLGAGVNGTGMISYNAYGGASPQGLQFNLNGTVQTFVVGPTSTTAGDFATWADATGNVLSDTPTTSLIFGSGSIDLSGDLSTTGPYPLAITLTGNTAITFPLSGTLATDTYVQDSFASPPSSGYGSITPEPVVATTIGASGQITSTVTTGTAPLVVASTTNVANLNASSLDGSTFASPPVTGYGYTTPEPVAATTISATSAITPSQTSGIVGTTTNNNANTGSVGEYISASVASGSAVSLTTATAADITHVSLTAGDWSCAGTVAFTIGTPADTTTTYAWTSTTSATAPTPPNNGGEGGLALPSGIGNSLINAGIQRFSLASTTNVYLSAISVFSGGSNSVYGFIGCRRVR